MAPQKQAIVNRGGVYYERFTRIQKPPEKLVKKPHRPADRAAFSIRALFQIYDLPGLPQGTAPTDPLLSPNVPQTSETIMFVNKLSIGFTEEDLSEVSDGYEM